MLALALCTVVEHLKGIHVYSLFCQALGHTEVTGKNVHFSIGTHINTTCTFRGIYISPPLSSTVSLTWIVGGERCLRVVVVESVVVVSIKVVDISGGTEVVVRAAPLLTGTSPTSRTLPFTLMLTWPSAAMLRTLRPL